MVTRANLFAEARPATGLDIGVLSLEGGDTVDWLIESDAAEAYADVSPDGRWVAYVSDESGQMEVYATR